MIRITLILALLFALPALAVEPDEMLGDPVLETRAQALDEVIRCVRCRSENIASSNADWAKDARLVVRELIEAGATDAEVLDFFVERYGDVVLMRPSAEGMNLLLWLAGPLMALVALGLSITYLRQRSEASEPEPEFSEEEQARLDQLLDP